MSTSTQSLLDGHHGTDYREVMEHLSSARNTRRYLEIGVFQGELLSKIRCDEAIAVDPSFDIKFNVLSGKRNVLLVQKESDEFFRGDQDLLLKRPTNLAFLDGLHLFEFLLRDFYNTERLCSRNSLIVMHDCLPLTTQMTNRDLATSSLEGLATSFPHYWTGDVWKIIPILKQHRPDLHITCVDSFPTGLVFVTNLDNTSNVLEDAYLQIVSEYSALASDRSTLMQFYDDLDLKPTESVMGLDHSLYFRV